MKPTTKKVTQTTIWNIYFIVIIIIIKSVCACVESVGLNGLWYVIS